MSDTYMVCIVWDGEKDQGRVLGQVSECDA